MNPQTSEVFLRSAESKTWNKECYDASSLFVNNILPEISELRFNHATCDCIIWTDDRRWFRAHKAILCCCSDYFKALFCGSLSTNSRQKPSRDVFIPETPSSAVAAMLNYIYTGRLRNITVSEVEPLLLLADVLIMPQLTLACEKFIASQLGIRNCLRFYNLTKRCYCPYLEEQVRKFLLRQCQLHTIWYCNRDFSKLSAEDLQSLLSDDDLNVRNEDHVLNIILRWIDADGPNRKSYFPFLLKSVRLGFCRPRFLLTVIERNQWVRKYPDSLDALENVALILRNNNITSKNAFRNESYWFRPRNPASIIFVIGGWMRSGVTSKIEIYNPVTRQWITSKYHDSSHPRAYHGVVKLDGFVYCLGGYDGNQCVSTVQRFDIERKVWSCVANMHMPRCYGAFVKSSCSTILAAGGYDGRQRSNKCEIYDISSNSWMTISPMRERRSDASAANCRDVVFVAGGYNGFEVLSSVELYRPERDTWTDITPMCCPRSGFRLLQEKSCLLAVAGFDGSKRLKTVERYESGFWTVVSKMSIARSNFMAVIVDEQLCAVGGYHAGEVTEDSVEKIHTKQCRGTSMSDEFWRFLPSLKGERSALDGCAISGVDLASFVYGDCSLEDSLESHV